MSSEVGTSPDLFVPVMMQPVVMPVSENLLVNPVNGVSWIRVIARLEPGVIGKLLECPATSADWCRVEIEESRGWLRRDEIWGVLPQEIYPQ